MKKTLIAPSKSSGGKLSSQKLAIALGATVISAELPLRRIKSEVVKNRFDVVDIQLEYRTFGSHLRTLTNLPALVFLLNGVAEVFVTVHGVLTYESLRGQRLRGLKWFAFLTSLRLAGLFGCHMVVHTDEMRRELIRYGLRDAVVIPHGSGPLSYRPQDTRVGTSSSSALFGLERGSRTSFQHSGKLSKLILNRSW